MPTIDLEEAKVLGALAIFNRCLKSGLAMAHSAFQRGLGDAGTCERALLIFDDVGGGRPVMDFNVVLPCGTRHLFSETITERADELEPAIVERGAAAATAIATGLIKSGKGA